MPSGTTRGTTIWTTTQPEAAVIRSLPLLIWLAALAGACGDGKTPRLANFDLRGQAPDAPTVLLLRVDFVDDSGDLGRGAMPTFVNGEPSALGALDLAPIFVANGLSFDATAGTLDFVVELTIDEATLPAEGAGFDLGITVVDEAGNESERATLPMTIRPAP